MLVIHQKPTTGNYRHRQNYVGRTVTRRRNLMDYTWIRHTCVLMPSSVALKRCAVWKLVFTPYSISQADGFTDLGVRLDCKPPRFWAPAALSKEISKCHLAKFGHLPTFSFDLSKIVKNGQKYNIDLVWNGTRGLMPASVGCSHSRPHLVNRHCLLKPGGLKEFKVGCCLNSKSC